MSDLVNLTIDGVPVSVPKGTMIIEAAKQAGVLIPHYCYHPGLPVAGVCRMCLVEVEKAPKLQIACATAVAEGQVVKIFTEQATEARKSVLEFLLINHPLDCPICDQAGECELQDFVFQEGRARTRYTPTYAKRFNPVEDFGGDILYVPNRCILCTRCVRFMEHAAGEDILNVSERGDRAYIGIHPDKEMDHAWAGNVVDLCPVGSLLSKDFLHKARAWELDHTASVCTGCSQGCNVTLDTRTDVVVRVRPRTNSSVNGHFMCDEGRTLYPRDEPWRPHRGAAGERRQHVGRRGLGSRAGQGHADLEGCQGQSRTARVGTGVHRSLVHGTARLLDGFDVTAGAYVRRSNEKEEPLPGFPNLALRPERSPNLAGAKALGFDDGLDKANKALSGAFRGHRAGQRTGRPAAPAPGRRGQRDLSGHRAARRGTQGAGGAPHCQRGGRRRHVRQSRQAGAALLPGQIGAGHGSARLVGGRRAAE